MKPFPQQEVRLETRTHTEPSLQWTEGPRSNTGGVQGPLGQAVSQMCTQSPAVLGSKGGGGHTGDLQEEPISVYRGDCPGL